MSMWLWWGIGLTLSTLAGSWVVIRYRHFGFPILMTIFAGYVLSANVLVPRLVKLELGITTLVLTTGSIIWPFTAQLSDMINEIYGKRKAYLAVIMAYMINLLFITFVYMGASAQALWSAEKEGFWLSYFKSAPRILLASSAAFLICQFIDVAIFAKLKQCFAQREKSTSLKGIIVFCAVRSITSDVVNMVLDGALFAVFAFLFVLPTEELLSLVIGSITAKGLLAIIDTPWFLAFRVGVRKVKREF